TPPSEEVATLVSVIALFSGSTLSMVVPAAIPGPVTVMPGVRLVVSIPETVVPLTVATRLMELLELTIAVQGSALRANSELRWESCGIVGSLASLAIWVRWNSSDDHHLVDCATWLNPGASFGCTWAGGVSVPVAIAGSKPTTGG